MAVSHIKSNTIADFTGTVTVFNSAGATTTALASALVRPSDWNSAHNQYMTLSGNTAGASTLSGTNIVLQGGANVILSATDQTIIFSASNQSVQTQGSVQVQGSTGAISFGNGNGITFGGNASTITASHNGITTGRASNDAIGLNSAFTAGPLAMTINSSGLSLNAASAAGTTTGFTGANISASMTHNTAGLAMSVSVAAPGAAAEANWMNLLGANTAGNTTASGSTIGLSGVNLTLSGTNASQVVISAPATSSIVGVSGINMSTNGSTVSIYPSDASYFAWPFNVMASTQTQTVGSNTSVVFPVELHDFERFNFIMLPGTVSIASMASIATTANSTLNYTQQATFNFVLYSRGTGASSQSLQSVASTSHSSAMGITVQQNANGSQWSVTHAFSFPASNTAQATVSATYATTLTNVNVSTTQLTMISGAKKLAFPWASSLTDNQYWLATGVITAQTTAGAASLSAMRVTQSMFAMTQANLTWGEFGSANNASIQALYGLGSYSKAAVGTTGSLGFSNISSSASHAIPYVTFARIA